jgi:16S rRNA (guanine527-N7)-methyltransferase
MKIETINELLKPYLGETVLSEQQLEMLSDYLDLLLKWNSKINLTAVREPEEIVRRHFGESLFAARHLLGNGRSLDLAAIDVGSGAGFPGLPMKIFAGGLRLTLIESNHKKATFLSEVCRALRLTDVTVSARRAEDLGVVGSLVTVRAVERYVEILTVARQLLMLGGRLGLLIAEPQIETARSTVPDLIWDEAIPLPLSESRVLLIGKLGR